MLTYEDCLDMSILTQDEIDAVAEHEHLSSIVALAKAEYLITAEGGERMIRKMIIDDIHHAQKTSNKEHETELKHVLALFIKTHPNHKSEHKSSN